MLKSTGGGIFQKRWLKIKTTFSAFRPLHEPNNPTRTIWMKHASIPSSVWSLDEILWAALHTLVLGACQPWITKRMSIYNDFWEFFFIFYESNDGLWGGFNYPPTYTGHSGFHSSKCWIVSIEDIHASTTGLRNTISIKVTLI